jgi:nicotinate phosphoribosyltransferase
MTRLDHRSPSVDDAPIISSRVDTDFYKLLMAQSVIRHRSAVEVTFAIVNRTKSVRLAEEVDEGELRAELDRTRSLALTPAEAAYLSGLEIGGRRIFTTAFVAAFADLRLPPYTLDVRDGQFELTFTGSWPAVMQWEVPALAILMELRSRAVLEGMPSTRRERLYAEAGARLDAKLERLSGLEGLRLADFGTRRRHSFSWQEEAVIRARDRLGGAFLGTSNVRLAMRHGVDPIGTSAHELPMVYAALADSDEALAAAPYAVLADWEADYATPFRILLPDTFGTAGFLARAPESVARWSGIRIDSGDPAGIAELAIEWWRAHGEDPREKVVIFSDGLDVAEIESLHDRFAGWVKVAFGWGTLLTNDFRGLCAADALAPFSLVCKAVSADGRPTVKLSDNPAKALGPPGELARYRRVFAVDGQEARPVEV